MTWLRNRRIRRILQQPFPVEDRQWLGQYFDPWSRLTERQRDRLCRCIAVLLAEKSWEAGRNLEIRHEMKLAVAAYASLMLIDMEHDYYSRVHTIILVATGYETTMERPLGASLTIESVDDVVGEAHYRGPVVLSWEEVSYDLKHPRDGRNVVLHEFAHQLDMLDGGVDGTPPLPESADVARWSEIMTAEFNRLRGAARSGQKTLLDEYGGQDVGEFFAVATESFFEQSVAMKRRHTELYSALSGFYKQDPAARDLPG